MKKGFTFLILMLAVFSFTVSTPAFAKKDGNPAGWLKGEKKGWDGAEASKGQLKADAKKAEKEAKKKQKEAERETKKKQKEAEKEARKKAKEAEKAAAKATA